MQRLRLGGAVLAVMILLGSAAPLQVGAAMLADSVVGQEMRTSLSPYWHYRIQRWERLVLAAAESRQLDPDFIAALMWHESSGNPDLESSAGAVGLLQVMPREAGFSWRPTRAELLNPTTNVYWGSNTLAMVVRQGRGDVFHALAAYNAGWDRVDSRVPRRFAGNVLREYAYALAARYELEEDARWVALFAVRRQGVIQGPIWVADVTRDDVYFYGNINQTPEGGRLIPNLPPTARLAWGEDESGMAYEVGIWLHLLEPDRWLTP